MKYSLILLSLGILTSCNAGAVTVNPSPSPEPSPVVSIGPIPPVVDVPPTKNGHLIWDCELDPQVTGYRCYLSQVSGQYAIGVGYFAQVDAVSCFSTPNSSVMNATCAFTIPTMVENYFVVTAINMNQTDPAYQESDPSVEVSYKYPAPLPSPAAHTPRLSIEE